MDKAIRTEAVSAPLPEELRPYIVLQTANATLPAGSRFGGHWVTAWRSRLPFIQIDRARSHEVGRCTPFAGDGDMAAMQALLRDASCLITEDETWLETAAAVGTPTIYLADGHAEAVPLPTALQTFQPNTLQVLRSDTNFRRDLPLRLINEALEAFVPGVTGDDRSESSLCRKRLQSYIGGRIADLGHGGHKVHPDAVGVDFFKFDAFDWIGDVRDLWFLAEQSFDSVYSSHCLEDLWHPHQALAEWTRILRPGGHLSLFLPLRDFYPNVGTPGANPGHKDDYVPDDVEQFLRELGNMEVVRSERIERENSFEVVAKKKAGRSFFMARDSRPKPEVSVLLVADPSQDPALDATAICATVAAAQVAFADCAHEVLVLDRTRKDGDLRAAVQDLAASDARVHVIEDRRPLPYGQRWDLVRRAATGKALLMLQPGTLLAPTAGKALREALAQGAQAAVPVVCSPLGGVYPDSVASSNCLLVAAEHWPNDALGNTPYGTSKLWQQVAARTNAVTVATANATTAAELGRPTSARGRSRLEFDHRLRAAGVDPMAPASSENLLVVMLRTLGDCVLATPVLTALRQRHPSAHIEVLTEPSYAWIFEQHAAVDAVLTVADVPVDGMFWAEDLAITTAIANGNYDRLIVLSDRLEHITYHHSGLTLADFYAIQAGVPEACGQAPEVCVAAEDQASWQQRQQQLAIPERYAVVHTRAGWFEKSLPPALAQSIVGELAAAGLTPVVIGGPGETVEHASAINLAGKLSMAESAAAIAGAELFVGPDSGPLHIASAFGTRSLALFGGSHLRIAPPRAHGSCSVQAASCCPVPCGVTPCPERHCGAAGLASDAVLPRLHEVLAGTVGDECEYWGIEPAHCVASPDGPTLVRHAEQFFAGTPTTSLASATRHKVQPPRTAPARSRGLEVAFDQTTLHQHVRQAHTVSTTVRELPQIASVLDTIRNGVAPAQGINVLQVLAAQCHELGAANAAMQTIAAGIAHCGAMMRGERGRARHAFVGHAGALLHQALSIHLPEPAGSKLRQQLFQVYRDETGAAPDSEHVIRAIAAVHDRIGDSEAHNYFLALLHEQLRAAQAHHGQALRWATMLRKADDPEGAAELLDAHRKWLPSSATIEIGETRFLRGTCLVAAGRTADALEDMRFAATALKSEQDRATAQTIVATLQRHLGSQPISV
jgi:ADP-heptose:LPS heptosyltransferase/SAM-dependent methyltransferase